ncbi:unnamed protein product [Caenorhabditis nigoni]
MTGIKLRNFDESAEEFSDVVLIVEDTKFYGLKKYLASQSSYFKAMFLGNFDESKKSEVTLSDIKSEHFQNFLELLYGESSIDESTIDGIVRLSHMYDAKLAIRKCEEFLVEYSEKSVKEKLKLAYKYGLKQLKLQLESWGSGSRSSGIGSSGAPERWDPELWDPELWDPEFRSSGALGSGALGSGALESGALESGALESGVPELWDPELWDPELWDPEFRSSGALGSGVLGSGVLGSGALGSGALGSGALGSEAQRWWRWNRRIVAGGSGIGGSEMVEVESEDQRWWRWNRRIGDGGGGIGGSEMVEVESEDRRWWRWNRRIGDGGSGIGGSEMVEVESEDRSWWKWNRRIGDGGGGIGGSEMVEVESEDQRWWRWNRRIGDGGVGIGGSEMVELESEDRRWWRIRDGGGGIGGSEMVEVESEDRRWWRWNRRIGDGGGGIGGSEMVEVESEDRRWWRWNRRIGDGGGGIGGSEMVEVESEDRRWWRWNRRIRDGGGGIGGSEMVEVESEDRRWWRWNRRIGDGGSGIGGSEMVEMESEDQRWWRWNRRIRDGGGGIGGSEMVEVESEDQRWWRWNRRIGDGGGGIGGSEMVEMESELVEVESELVEVESQLFSTMPKNKGKGGKNRRRGKNENFSMKRELELKEEGQEYGQVSKLLGNSRVHVYCFDGAQRVCHIRGKLRKKAWINVGDIILVGLRDYQDDKGDVILKYHPDEARRLKMDGWIPENAKLNENDEQDEEEVIKMEPERKKRAGGVEEDEEYNRNKYINREWLVNPEKKTVVEVLRGKISGYSIVLKDGQHGQSSNFSKMEVCEEETGNIYETVFVMCTECGGVFSSNGGHLKRHRNERCQGTPQREVRSESASNRKDFHSAVVEFFGKSGKPLYQLENSNFKEFVVEIAKLGQRYEGTIGEEIVPKRTSGRIMVDNWLSEKIGDLKDFVAPFMANKTAAVLADFGKLHYDFLGIKIAFLDTLIDEEGVQYWKLVIAPVAMSACRMKSKDSAAVFHSIKESIEQFCQDVELSDLFLVADGASNVRASGRNYFLSYIRCSAHASEIVGKRMLSPYKRDKPSPLEQISLKKYSDLLEKCKEITAELKADKMEFKALGISLVNPVETRWMSRYMCCLQVYANVSKLIANLHNFRGKKSEDLILEIASNENRRLFDELNSIYASIKQVNDLFQSNDTTISDVLPAYLGLLDDFNDVGTSQSATDDVRTLVKFAIYAVKKQISDCSTAHFLSYYLHPGYKDMKVLQTRFNNYGMLVDVENQMKMAMTEINGIVNEPSSPNTSLKPSPSTSTTDTFITRRMNKAVTKTTLTLEMEMLLYEQDLVVSDPSRLQAKQTSKEVSVFFAMFTLTQEEHWI